MKKILEDFQKVLDLNIQKIKKKYKEIFADLSSGRVMDRLLSGDVGFGKTEVAMNAMLAVILDGFQTVFVCPTTLLASQHYHQFKKDLKSLE
jgi:transcription-repair coupling factor (superfamily II helicase)